MDTASSTARMKQLFLEVSLESIRASSEIVDYAREKLETNLKKNIYITLTDHIDFAVERCRKGISFKSALFWEIKTYYKREFEVGEHALSIIEKYVGIALPEEEAASIALHLVNAEYDGNLSHTELAIDVVSTALGIVRVLMGAPFDENSLDYQRFVTHLLFFSQRIQEGKKLDKMESFLYDSMRTNYPKAFQCAEKIARYVKRQYDLEIDEEEMTFLTVHIARVTGKGIQT